MKLYETKEAKKDRQLIFKSYPKAIQNKLQYFFIEILDEPENLNATGNPEQLKGMNYPAYSRRLTDKDRVVYAIEPGADYGMPEESEIIVFYQYLGHYSDK